MVPYHFTSGNSPLVVSMPHAGTRLCPEVERNVTEAGHAVADTDWYVDLLYDFLEDMGVSILIADYSRTVIDLNRNVLYPGQSETELCPTTGFDNQPLYKAGGAPGEQEIRQRKEIYWQPWHDKIRRELDRIKTKYGYALLWDAHSIQSRVPRFFDGQLPDLNLGTGAGTSCDIDLADGLLSIAGNSPYSAVLNGRFKGGYITRHYGNPGQNIHAVQLEISQTTYMDETPPIKFRKDLADRLRPTLRAMTDYMLTYVPNLRN